MEEGYWSTRNRRDVLSGKDQKSQEARQPLTTSKVGRMSIPGGFNCFGLVSLNHKRLRQFNLRTG